MIMPKMILDWKTANDFVTDAFVGVGVPREDAAICADVLLEADRRGIESHGCNRFKPIYIDRINDGIQNPVTNFEIVKETPTTAVVDGHDGMGQVIGYKSMKLAIEKAKQYGMGMVVVRNSCHYGIAGYYPTMACKEGCIGITGTNARPSVAPTFGVEGMFGTNPLTIGIPSDEDFDFLIDCATSITQNGKIEYYARINEDVHPGTIVDIDGKPVEGDAGVALKKIRNGTAALTTLGGIGEALGGYKGYGYAMVVELLSAVHTFYYHSSALLCQLRKIIKYFQPRPAALLRVELAAVDKPSVSHHGAYLGAVLAVGIQVFILTKRLIAVYEIYILLLTQPVKQP